MKKINQLNRLYKPLFFVILTLYCIVFSRFGFENWDTGFVNGFCWRILQGEAPYRDFIHIRPPASLYLHALILKILPVAGQIFYTRVIGYLLFALLSFFVVFGLDRIYKLRDYGIDKWAAMSVCFITSVHNFFPDPWYNVDGLLFACAAFYIYTYKGNPNLLRIFGIALLCLLSALTKQSFYFVPIVFLIWIFIDLGLKKMMVFLISLLVLGALFWLWLQSVTTFENYLSQVSGSGHPLNLMNIGLGTFIHAYHNKYIFATVVLLPILFLWIESRQIPRPLPYLKWLSVVIALSALIALPILLFKETMVIFFNAVVVALVYKIWKQKTIVRYIPIIVLLSICWCVTLSIGYRSPVLLSGALVLSFIVLMHEDFLLWKIQKVLKYILIPVCGYVLLLNLYPYRSKIITMQTFSLEPTSPKLTFLKTDKASFEKLLELKQLVNSYPEYITAPALPLSHYLYDKKNPVPVDWILNFDINNNVDGFLRLVSRKKIHIFLEKSFIEGEPFITNNEDRKKNSSFSVFIYEKCHPIANTKHFLVYDSSELQKYIH